MWVVGACKVVGTCGEIAMGKAGNWRVHALFAAGVLVSECEAGA